MWAKNFPTGLKSEIFGGEELFTVIGGTEVALDPLNVGTASGFFGFSIPAGSRTLLHPFAIVGGKQNQLFAALGTVLVEFFGAAIDPFNIVTAGRLFGFLVPSTSAALLHLFTETGKLQH